MLTDYRIYLVEGKNHIGGPPHIIEAENDKVAIAKAAAHRVYGYNVEIWQGARQVKRIPSEGRSSDRDGASGRRLQHGSCRKSP